jgi:arsenate reductase
LRGFLQLLNVEPKELFHSGSFEKLGRDIEDYNSFEAAIGLLLEHPEVMNRPVCIRGDRAVIARPAELVNEILD